MKEYGHMVQGTSPEGDRGGYAFHQLVELAQIEKLLRSHHNLSGITYSLFDTGENDLITVGWQDICARFHRVNPVSCARCRESDAWIKTHLHDFASDCLEYRCKNGMIHVAMPIVIEGEHVATFFATQFFYDDDRPDPQYFRNQAATFGFDAAAYLDALARVPVFSRDHVRGNILFLCDMVKMLAEMGLNNRRLAREVAERRRAEERLALLDFALEHVREAAYIIDEDARLRYVNHEACRALEYGRDELLGLTVADIAPDFPPECWADRWQSLKIHGSRIIEGRHRAKDGHILSVEINSNYFEYRGHGYNLALVHDITERQRLEKEIRNSRDYLANIINAIADPVFVKDAEHRLVLVNDAECALAGCSREELLGKTDYDFFPREQVDVFWKMDDRVLASGETNVNEELITGADGRIRIIVTHKSRYVDPQGNRFVVGVIRDITGRKQLEDELRTKEQYQRALLDNFPYMVWLKDTESRLLAVNRPYLEIAGLEADAPYFGKTDLDLFPAELAERYRADDRKVMRSRQKKIVEEIVGVPGKQRWHETYKAPVLDTDGQLLGTVGFACDISEHKRTESVNMARLRLLQFAATHTLDELLQATLDEAEAVSGSLIGFYHFLEADQKTLALQSWSARTKTEACRAEKGGTHYDVSAAGVWVDCIHERRAVIHNDYAALSHRRGMPPGHARVIRELVVPVFRGEKIVAILGVGNKSLDYSPEDVEAVSLLADLAWDIAERKRAEEALAAREREFRTLAENAPDNIARYDRQCRWVYLNPEMEKTLAVDPALVLGKTPLEIGASDPKTVAEYENHIRRVLECGEPDELEIVIPHPTGEFRTHLIRFVAERDLDGNVAGVLAIGRDITSIKNTESELREVKSRLAAMLTTIPDLVWLKDLKGIYLACNPAFERFFGAREAEILGKTDHDFVDAALADFFIEKDRAAMAAGTVCINEEEIVYAEDGRRGLLETRKIPVHTPDGQIMGVLGIARDITERKRMEEQLRSSEQQLRTLAETSPGVMYSFLLRPDGTSCMPYISPRIEELNGLCPADMATDMAEANARIHPDDVGSVLDSIAESARTLLPWHAEFRWRHPVKGEVWVEGRSTPERQPDGGTLWSGFFHDITKHKKLEHELFMARKMEIIGQLAGGVAHEVRNPLNAILSISEALFKEKEIAGNPEYQPYIGHIRSQVNRLSRLMTDLLELGKPITPAKIKPVPLGRLCAETIGLWNVTAAAKEHPVVFVCDAEHGGPWAYADAARLQQAILNLIENAAQSSPPGSEILLRIALPGWRTVAVEIRDRGKGIDREKIERVFEPFFTLRRGGTGLGLTLVKHFIEHMGGEIRMRNNEPPPGCTAELILNTTRKRKFGYETKDTAD